MSGRCGRSPRWARPPRRTAHGLGPGALTRSRRLHVPVPSTSPVPFDRPMIPARLSRTRPNGSTSLVRRQGRSRSQERRWPPPTPPIPEAACSVEHLGAHVTVNRADESIMADVVDRPVGWTQSTSGMFTGHVVLRISGGRSVDGRATCSVMSYPARAALRHWRSRTPRNRRGVCATPSAAVPARSWPSRPRRPARDTPDRALSRRPPHTV